MDKPPSPQGASSPPPQADRVVISVNPKAGGKSAADRVGHLVQLLEKQGFAAEMHTALAEAADRAAHWHAQGRLRALVGVGGDGTAAELVNRTPPGLPVTMLPAGNENLLAKHFGLGGTPEAVCETIARGTLRRIDAGSANGRVFLLMASCGLDADVVRRVHARRRGHIRSRDYLKPLWESIRSYAYPELRVYWDDIGSPERSGPADGLPERAACGASPTAAVVRWLFAFNLPCYAAGLRLAPQASGSDGMLDLCAFREGSLRHGLRYAAAVVLGRHQSLGDCTVRRARRLRVTAETEVPYQLDGDPGGVLPLDIEVLPGRWTLLTPNATISARRAGGG